MKFNTQTLWNDFATAQKESSTYQNQLLKEIDPSYIQRVYTIEMRIRIDKRAGGNKEQTLDEIRGIPEITVVSVIEGTSESDVNSYVTTLRCKFELTGGRHPITYRQQKLIPSLVGIKGLRIIHLSRPEEVAEL
jgi:hypothetical protein